MDRSFFPSISKIQHIYIHTYINTYIQHTLLLFIVVQSPSHIQLFVSPRTRARQASLSLTISWSLSKFMPIKSVMPPNHLILCQPLLLLPSIFPRIRVFSNESVLHIRWPKYWSFRFSISLSKSSQG